MKRRTDSFVFPDLRGRTAVLTGAAQGIGKVLSQALAEQGMRLVLIDRDGGKLRRHAQRLAQVTPVEPLVCDLADAAQRAEVAASIARSRRVVDAVVHNAAIDPRAAIDDTEDELFRRVIATNVEPAVAFTRALLPNLKRSGAGRIVLIGSVTFELGTALLSAYVASKGAIVGLTRSLAHELGPAGITVNCIAPGSIRVERTRRFYRGAGRERIVQLQSVRRPITPQDLAGPLCLLLSGAGGAITAQVLTVDGGLLHPIAAAARQRQVLEE